MFRSPQNFRTFLTVVMTYTLDMVGFAQFFGSPLAGALADHFVRYKVFLVTIGLSIIGYAVMAYSVYSQSLSLLFFVK